MDNHAVVVLPFKKDEVTLTHETATELLHLLVTPERQPVYVHCLDGVTATGHPTPTLPLTLTLTLRLPLHVHALPRRRHRHRHVDHVSTQATAVGAAAHRGRVHALRPATRRPALATRTPARSNVPPRQRPSSAPVPPQGTAGGCEQLGTPRAIQGEAKPLGAQPLPRVRELAASNAADPTAFGRVGATAACHRATPTSSRRRWSTSIVCCHTLRARPLDRPTPGRAATHMSVT